MKYSLSEYAIDSEHEQKLKNKKSAFTDVTNTRKAVHLTMVTTFGIKANAHSGIVQNEVKLDDFYPGDLISRSIFGGTLRGSGYVE